MKLSFSVLWFDDSETYFDSLDLDDLVNDIVSWGFAPNIIPVTTAEEFRAYAPYAEFDLIVLDRTLEGYQEGQEFIAELRSHAVYTEVIFYTAGNASDLWDAIYSKQLEGVFVSNRTNILSKISSVGFQSVRKILDLDNMRGIVMAELGELDHALDEILSSGLPHLPADEQNKIFNKFHKQLASQNKSSIKRTEAFKENPSIDEMIGLSDSYKRWLNFQRLCSFHKSLKDMDEIGDFNAEILQPRNFLAHAKPIVENDVYIFRHGEKEYRFDNAVSAELRRTIIKYKNEFTKIINLLS